MTKEELEAQARAMVNHGKQGEGASRAGSGIGPVGDGNQGTASDQHAMAIRRTIEMKDIGISHTNRKTAQAQPGNTWAVCNYFFSFPICFSLNTVKKNEEVKKTKKRTNNKESRVKRCSSAQGLMKGQMKAFSCSGHWEWLVCVSAQHRDRARVCPADFVMG